MNNKNNEINKGDNITGYEKLKKAAEKDCNEYCGCFNPDGCDKKNQKVEDKRCQHAYCDKFKWIIDRAKNYGEKTGLNWQEILNKWEDAREYWYMNYYQECNQPEIKGDKVKVFETVEDCKKAIEKNEYRCPCCKGVTTNPTECNSGEKINGKTCDWKVYGFFGGLGKEAHVFIKETMLLHKIFMPIAWEVRDKEVSHVQSDN